MMRALRFGLLAMTWSLASCTIITNFDDSRVVEQTEALCSDEVDNDEDGLTDCQDWKCLDRANCCNLPAIVLEEDFAPIGCAEMACDDPALADACGADQVLSSTLWQAWGSPMPTVCEGTLNPFKTNKCYSVGVLSRPTVDLSPGLEIRVGIVGQPDRGGGHLEVGLTFQSEMAGSAQACTVVQPAYVFAALKTELAAGGEGYVIGAYFTGKRIGLSPVVSAGGNQLLRITVDDNRKFQYWLGETMFAESPSTVDGLGPAPAHIILRGLGTSARFADVTASTGTQCDLPASWSTEPREELPPAEGSSQWDSYSVQHPALIPGEGPTVHLYYTGCLGSLGECFLHGSGIGLASSLLEGDPFVRVGDEPIVDTRNVGIIGADGPLDAEIVLIEGDDEPELRSYIDVGRGDPNLYEATPPGGRMFTEMGPLTHVFGPGMASDWDGREVCCASMVIRGSETLVWYAGRSLVDDTWKIGLARKVADGPFIKDPSNPVLTNGELGSFDDRTVTNPEVIYDERRGLFRMWYQAESVRDKPGGGSIAYAVSLDGVTWHKYPENPILTPENTGLESIGGPAILDRLGRFRLFFHAHVPDDPLGFRIFSVDRVRFDADDVDDTSE